MRGRASPPPVPTDPLEWRPLEAQPTRRAPSIRDPIVEPMWEGLRVLAHFELGGGADAAPRVELRDDDGLDVTRRFADVVGVLATAITAFDAVIDGFLTDQATATDIGTAIVPQAQASPVGMMLSQAPQVTIGPRPEQREATAVAFVAIDLLRVDGQSLLELPLLERKRQLESLIVQGELVRVSVFARPPVAPWLNSWKSAGFRGAMLKAANSRYQPGGRTTEWAPVLTTGQR